MINDPFYNKTAQLLRFGEVAGEHYDEARAIASSVCHIQPVQDKTQLYSEAEWGQEHWLFSPITWTVLDDYTSIYGNTTKPVPGDTILIGNVQYGVQGVSELEDPFEGDDQHLKLVVTRQTSTVYDDFS